MKVTLNLTGPELVLLYLAYGNEEAGKLVLEASRREQAATQGGKKNGRRKRI